MLSYPLEARLEHYETAEADAGPLVSSELCKP